MPMSGRLMITSIRLPIHMLAIMPQNILGRSLMICGPGWMPWMVSAPIISAMAEFSWAARGAFLERVGGERAQGRTAAGKHAEDGAERGTAQHRRPGTA